MLRSLFGLVLLALVFNPAGADAGELIQPDPSITPEQVVEIQLRALMENDTPEADFGISQTWAFAHPDNRAVTGPLAGFAQMMKGPYYNALINHRSHTISEMNRTRDWVQFKVMMEDRMGRVLAFLWVVKQVKTAPYADCWMTSAVSAPVPAGQGS